MAGSTHFRVHTGVAVSDSKLIVRHPENSIRLMFSQHSLLWAVSRQNTKGDGASPQQQQRATAVNGAIWQKFSFLLVILQQMPTPPV